MRHGESWTRFLDDVQYQEYKASQPQLSLVERAEKVSRTLTYWRQEAMKRYETERPQMDFNDFLLIYAAERYLGL